MNEEESKGKQEQSTITKLNLKLKDVAKSNENNAVLL